ncbi:MAG: beta-ketoacyl-[acyl-carrier-protein] synthase family protein [Deltaproteobacteria bacterium]|nr:beta-ketoacyl-[acyl-carrier-protein] synthase family protein [Deltaproteobacteria bacterium]
MKRRVVIVSAGVLAPVGSTWEEFQRNIFLERDWFEPLAKELPYPAGARVDDAALDAFYRQKGRAFKYRRYYNRATDMAVVAAFECLKNLQPASIDPQEMNLFWGAGPNFDLSAIPEATFSVEPADQPKSHHGVSAAWMLLYLPNMTASAISCALGIRGETLTYLTACAAASHAIGEAFLKIRNGDLDCVLCGGSDSRLNRGGLQAYKMLGALSPSPEPRVLPFCKERDGFVPGEGAAAFLLMDADTAQTLNTPILAELVGYGSSSDGFRLTDPEPGGLGMETAMKKALRMARMAPGEIDLIDAHGTGTLKNDAAEAAAIRRVFPFPVPVTSNKSQFGHLSAAAGALELAACLAMLRRGEATPTVNTVGKTVEEGIELVRENRSMPLRTILSNSFGFGGENCALVVKRWEP